MATPLLDAANPKILYGCVLQPPTLVLAEHGDGNIRQVLKRCRLKTTDEWKSYVYGDQAFHYIWDVSAGLCYLCTADKQLGRKVPFAFLGQVQQAFKQKFPAGARKNCAPEDFQAFTANIQALMQHHCPSDDRVSSLMAKVECVNENLAESMDKLMERQEIIDVLVERSDSLASSSLTFQEDAKILRKTYWWRNTKVLIVFFVSAISIIGLLTWIEAS